ncbi:hypothetical protein AMS68_004620 [Peltaster fructicola]|uniref:Major facilitator superfamily (MFS) profile domain-containing protein n=1 Tax=Peltaster fructicola TaxID=286661 RepID=A0A6H0XWH7_9PEZI|nr:hypothetical protein AMS68_004620 [Peltaster fructicola]
MSLHALAGIELASQPSKDVTFPTAVKTRTVGPTIEELDAIYLPEYPTSKTPSRLDSGLVTPDLEASLPPTPHQHLTSTAVVPTIWFPYMNRWRVLAACMVYLANGINDSSTGALIPYLESWYIIGYAVVSLIFVTNAVGFILAAFFADAICDRLGRAKSLMLSECIIAVGYVIIATTPPFGAVIAAYLVLGFGSALNLAYNNVYCAGLAQPTIILGLAHGSYGIGGILGPVMATALVSSGVIWSRFFFITIGLRALCLVLVGWSFWSYEEEEMTHFSQNLERLASQQRAEEGQPSKIQMLGQALANRTVLIGALFIFAYQGAEVADSGWFISFLINYRDGDPAHVGYVTSGFWAGITVGRFVLTHVAHRVGEKTFVFGLGIASIVFQTIAWLVPSIIGDAVAISILGLVLGPIYPCAQTVFSRLLPRKLQVVGVSFISSAGSSGGAVVPLMTGLIAQAVGTYALHPICIAFFAAMLVGWALLPKVDKRRE